MLYEWRKYYINPGHRKDIEDLFRNTNLENFKRHGISVEGMWYSKTEDVLYYMLKFKDEEDQKAKWAEFYGDPGWKPDVDKWNAERGDVMSKFDTFNLEPIDFYDESFSRF